MSNILDEIKKSSEERVKNIKENNAFAFEKALKKDGISFICEVKKASPSKGIIAEKFDYVKIAKEYEKAGASAISVLTEPKYFLGNINYLKEIKENVSIPVLRKDFIVDEYQIYEAKAFGADAILLICAILDEEKIKKYIKIADSLGLSALVEAHDEDEVIKALKCKARVIGVNNRNLKNFTVDINNSVNLRKLVPENVVFVSESGIKTPNDVKRLVDNKTDAVLIGETFMRSENKEKELKLLKGEIKMPPKVKICGIRREEDVKIANKYLPEYIGFIFAKSKRQINFKEAKNLKQNLDERIKTVGVFVNEEINNIIFALKENIIDYVQLHGDEDDNYINNLKEAMKKENIESQKNIIKAFRIRNKEDIKKANSSNADYILLDAYSNVAEGGNGIVFNWKLIENVQRPFFLAGGINIENVKEAIKNINLFAIDVSSGVETNGFKDEDKIKCLIEGVRNE